MPSAIKNKYVRYISYVLLILIFILVVIPIISFLLEIVFKDGVMIGTVIRAYSIC